MLLIMGASHGCDCKGFPVGQTVIVLVLLVVSGAIAYIIWKQAQNSSSSSSKGRPPRATSADKIAKKVEGKAPAKSSGKATAKTPKKAVLKSSGRATVRRGGKHPAPPLNPYRATSIQPGKKAGEGVLALEQEGLLVDTAQIPTIPVAGCKSFNCSCKYVKHNDRRNSMEGDRRALGGLRRDLMSQAQDSERRTVRRGRRSED